MSDERDIELDDWDPQALDGEHGIDVADDDGAAFEDEVDAKLLALRSLYVASGRDAVLARNFERLLKERDSPNPIRRWAGLLLMAPSGAGKTRMMSRFLAAHPRVHDFAGDDSNFIGIDVPSPVTNKSLGLAVLRSMYPQQRTVPPTGPKANMDSASRLSDIWDEARKISADLDILGLWIDEAHDLANGGPNTMTILRASLKRWMAHEHRPLLILSGTPELAALFETREFRRRFLVVESPELTADADTAHLRRMIARYAREVDLGIDSSLEDFMPRLIHAGTRQIGWTLDLVLEAIRVALLESADRLAIEHFADAYSDISGCDADNNPFTADDWSGIDTVLHRDRDFVEPKRPRRRRRKDTPW
ncbi:TniB protein [Devosia lucknowensis]|uniref:TniB protein n=1 Tax=Devosia lucknowensis TaxID=1096929 RepID=A0A1Y6F7C2_9HYPH|nr:ATP-binding protein [Devosia lucknowensis]SMQ68632.1 TniB protein [Devosia lucknowensis]